MYQIDMDCAKTTDANNSSLTILFLPFCLLVLSIHISMCSHFNVPVNYAANLTLAMWANQQRSNYRNQVLGKKTSKSVREHNQKLIDIGFNFHVDPDQESTGGKDPSSKKRKGSASTKEKGADDDDASSEARKPAAKKLKRSGDNDLDEGASLPPLHDGVFQDAPLPPLHDIGLQDNSIDAHDDIDAVFADI